MSAPVPQWKRPLCWCPGRRAGPTCSPCCRQPAQGPWRGDTSPEIASFLSPQEAGFFQADKREKHPGLSLSQGSFQQQWRGELSPCQGPGVVQGEPAPYCSAAPGDQARLKPPNAPAPEQKLPLCWFPGGLSAQVGGPVCLQELGRTRRSIETVSHQAPGAFTAERRGISVLTWSSSSATSWPSDRGTTFKVPELGSTRRNNSRDHSWGRAPRGLLAAGSWRRGPLHGGRTVYSLQRMPASPGMQAVMLGSSQLAWGQLPTKSLWGWSECPRGSERPVTRGIQVRLRGLKTDCAVQERSPLPHKHLNWG